MKPLNLKTARISKLQDLLVTMPFGQIVFWWVVAYLAIGVVFAFIYWCFQDQLGPVQPSWDQIVSFSFVTQATIGYGNVWPIGWLQAIANLQALVGTGLNGAAIGLLTFRLLVRSPPLRLPRAIAVFPTSDESFAVRFRYLNIDTKALVNLKVEAWYIADAAHQNTFYDAWAGRIGGMELSVAEPMVVMALTIPMATRPTDIRKPGSRAETNDQLIEFHPDMFVRDGQVDATAKLLFSITGENSALGQTFSTSMVYRANDIVCAPFDEINNSEYERLDETPRREAIQGKFERFIPTGEARCRMCRDLEICPFRKSWPV